MTSIDQKLKAYENYLKDQQLADSTIKIYLRDIKALEEYLVNTDRKKADFIAYINNLKDQEIKGKKGTRPKYKLTTLNNKIISINKYLGFTGEQDKSLKEFKIQDTENVKTLTDNDFQRLLRQADSKGTDRDRLMLLIFYHTGIRVSELSFFTVEAVKRGYMEPTNKGKTRIVGISKSLVNEAKEYIKNHEIKTGSIVLNNQGRPLGRSYIFKRMKYLGGQARISLDKVYPHSIRHLFAKNMVEKHNINPLQLADILGHESISTTRQYTKLGLEEVKKLMDF